MNRAAATVVSDASLEFFEQQLAKPLVLSGGAITHVFQVEATVRVRVGELEATGKGAVYLSPLWAWPKSSRTVDERVELLRAICLAAARRINRLCGVGPAHPWDLGLHLHASAVDDWPLLDASAEYHAARREFRAALPSDMPELARVLCLSPFDAALHDAAGAALGCSAMGLYDFSTSIAAADCWFFDGEACRRIRQLLRPTPRRVFPAMFVVGPSDPLESHLDHWILDRRYRRAKLKLMGRDPCADARFVTTVVRGMRQRGVAAPWLILDANAAYPNIAAVERLLDVLETDPSTWQAVQYLEQPLPCEHVDDAARWRRCAARKAMLIDEGLTSPAALLKALESGWSGAALKTCKGHSFTLLAATLLHVHGGLAALHDLTNPGAAAIQAACLASWLPTINGLELNSPQFTPDANADWLPRWSPLLDPRDGVHRLPPNLPVGLGGKAR